MGWLQWFVILGLAVSIWNMYRAERNLNEMERSLKKIESTYEQDEVSCG